MSPKIEPGAAPHYHADIINNAKETKRRKKIAAVQRKAKQPKSSKKSFALEMAILPKRGKTRLARRRRKTTMNWEGSDASRARKDWAAGGKISHCVVLLLLLVASCFI